jgi:hypothetical protein
VRVDLRVVAKVGEERRVEIVLRVVVQEPGRTICRMQSLIALRKVSACKQGECFNLGVERMGYTRRNPHHFPQSS